MTVPSPRRYFLRTLAMSIAAVLFRPLFSEFRRQGSSATEAIITRLTSVYTHRESAELIGREYLRSAPAEKNIDRLIHLISATSSNKQLELGQMDSKMLQATLSAQQRDDFANNRTIKVHGWILSETEVRLCALTALTPAVAATNKPGNPALS